jgi:hypothetical protein
MSKIQAVLFDKAIYTIGSATSKLHNMGLKAIKPPHITDKKIRFRLEDPDDFDHFATLKKGQGIELIIGYYTRQP